MAIKLTLSAAIGAAAALQLNRAVFSKPTGTNPYRRCTVESKNGGYHISRYTEKQAFHENTENRLAPLFEKEFSLWRQFNCFDEHNEHIFMLNKKGDEVTYIKKSLSATAPKAPEQTHNRQKNYILSETEPIAPLVDMGVFTKEGKLAAPMRDKFAQINRFLEIVADTLKEDGYIERKDRPPLKVIDFGCGKSYLTFVLYHYFVNVLGIEVEMTGLDLKADVIEKCSQAAKRYGYNGLTFVKGDIAGYDASAPADMVVTLHACDTATDFALHNALCRGARMILSVPCCQHELNGQISGENLALLSRYGIIKERFCALATDSIRAALLESRGYKTQVLEFVDLSHTPKNLLIRAVKKRPVLNAPGQKALAQAKELMAQFGFVPTLYRLIYGE